jgi:hypothetical protein
MRGLRGMMILSRLFLSADTYLHGWVHRGNERQGDLTQCRRFDNLRATLVHKRRKVPDATRDNCFRDIGFGVAEFGDGPAT